MPSERGQKPRRAEKSRPAISESQSGPLPQIAAQPSPSPSEAVRRNSSQRLPSVVQAPPLLWPLCGDLQTFMHEEREKDAADASIADEARDDGDADVNALDREGCTAVMHAAAHGRVAALEALVARGADVDRTGRADAKTALYFAVQNEELDATRALLAAREKRRAACGGAVLAPP